MHSGMNFHKEVYVLLFHLWDRQSQGYAVESDPQEAVYKMFLKAARDLREDYNLDRIRTEIQELPDSVRSKTEQAFSRIFQLLARANLSRQEEHVMRLEVALSFHGQTWEDADKGKFLNMGLVLTGRPPIEPGRNCSGPQKLTLAGC